MVCDVLTAIVLVACCAAIAVAAIKGITVVHKYEVPEQPTYSPISQADYDEAVEERKQMIDAAQAVQNIFLDLDDEEANF